MGTENEIKTRRPRRSKADIEEAIQKAATAQIKKKGFSLALVTDIVKRAKIEPIVFYNRYKNLDEFYDTFVKNYDYWLSDLLNSHKDCIGTENGYAEILSILMHKLLDEQIMTELLRWEVSEGNHITERTAKIRELHCNEIIEIHKDAFPDTDVDVRAITTLIVAGIYFLVLHKDRSTFGDIDINTPAGLRRLDEAFRSLASMLFRYRECKEQTRVIEERMRREGIPDEVIVRCMKDLI